MDRVEKVGQLMKDKVAMKLYGTLEILESKMDTLINELEGNLIKSITGTDFYCNAFSSILKPK
ncbi:hypothetical protein [Flavobacterium algoritolerans]|uniref:Uncharacterized protein n=1 Tax=Flavobacterium algoritolerans TaxID=3041254 RepID=A0ABT6VEV0_9FLAO|nr:hypothetical protein [Flavobacterium algoritolerans]MDI5895983.1 hypothetical protein [Flavobacterium algoritolerans]